MDTLNLEKIKIGQVIKNYRELCKICGWKVTTGTAKKAQLKELARYFKWHKDGNKFVIDEIYDTPLAKIDNRKYHTGKNSNSRNNNIYGKFIDPILLDYFCNRKNKILYYTTNQLAVIAGIINKNYGVAFSNKNDFLNFSAKDITINKSAETDFFSIVKGSLKDTIKSSLKRLQKNGYIKFKETYLLSFQYEVRNTTEEENELIQEIEKSVFEKMKKEEKITTKNQLQYNDKLRKIYYNEIANEVQDQIENVDMIYRGYNIIVGEDIVSSNVDVNILKNNLNSIFINKTMEKLHKRHMKEKNNHKFWGKPNPFWDKYTIDRINKSYIPYCKYITDMLLNIHNAINIRNII
ncbi:hypothetical protein [Clostridium tyrobutyricum]|uniref:hypothetical protein n=1 Tax=Clostridium tyrobutyricum TaxID=1519 RepID=UPI0010AB1C72|nr:hypothetical protein [Clostridium tyrobutyricum]QCH28019.1 hypothetical protein EZN00_01620 [Clostridium tyrobutyricum]